MPVVTGQECSLAPWTVGGVNGGRRLNGWRGERWTGAMSASMPVVTGQEPVGKRTMVKGVEMTEWVLDRSRGCTPAGTTGREQPLFTEQLVVLGVGEEPRC